MLQSIEILQLTTSDLQELVAKAVAENEVLEVRPAADPVLPLAAATWEPAGRDDGERDTKRAFLEEQPARTAALLDHICEQVAFLDLPDEVAAAVRSIAAMLDDRGLLSIGVAALPAACGLPPDVAGAALRTLRSLDPKGLGAGSAVEAMLLQAATDPDFNTIHALLTEHLDALARNRLPEVARAVAMSIDDLTQLLARMRELDPRPGARFQATAVAAIRPDVYVVCEQDELIVALADGVVPELAINDDYLTLLRQASIEPAAREYLQKKLRNARDLIGAISMRQATLLRVVEAVMQRQRPFLRSGRAALRPLRMDEIAQALSLHSSTISRATAGKYVATEIGVFRLRDFFDGGRDGAEPAAGQARGAVAQRLADLIAGEDKSAPMSDDALVESLQALGLKVARRTVTKFRQEMGIPSSYRRRRHGGNKR